MYRFVVPVLITTFAACKSAPEPMHAQANGPRYQITFTGAWTAESHPLEYPKAGLLSAPHFSGLIGASHRTGYEIFREGSMPTPGLEKLSEEGKHSPLDDQIRAAIDRGEAGALFESDPIKDMSQPAVTTVQVDERFPMISAVAMIAPSPDWFAGVADVALMKDGNWIDAIEVELFAWDSGGDDGATYEASDADTSPKKPTMLNASAHFMRDGKKVPVGRLTIKKL